MSIEFNFHELKAVDRLPSPSGTALAIMKLTQRDDTTIEQVGQLVQLDPALTSRVLSFANSASFGSRRQFAKVSDAVVMLGMKTVRKFALSLSLVDTYCRGRCKKFNYEAYWSQSLALAVAIAALVKRERTEAPGEAFTLGLLAEIGRLALATAWPEEYSACLSEKNDKHLLTLEQERFVIDHESLSYMLLDDWGLPEVFISSLKLSNEASLQNPTANARFAQQLVFAKFIAQFVLADNPSKAALLSELETQARSHSLYGTDLHDFVAEITQQWHEWGKLINIKTDISLSHDLDDNGLQDKNQCFEILLADSDLMQLAHISKQLSLGGHKLITCKNSEEALQATTEHHPQILIINSDLSPMNGEELCRVLRASEFGKNIYIIMIANKGSEDRLIQAFDSGVDDFIYIPFNPDVLRARLKAGERFISLKQSLWLKQKAIERFSAELSVANRRLKKMAHTDQLTSLPNRRYALSRLEQEWTTAQRHSRPISVLMLDLDHFKKVNDSLGHEAGDQVLKHTAQIMRETARTGDITCRLGGEEFLIIAVNTDSSQALLFAERVRKNIETHQPEKLPLMRPVTVSIGVSGCKDGTSHWQTLLKLADEALYKVKNSTRNGVGLIEE